MAQHAQDTETSEGSADFDGSGECFSLTLATGPETGRRLIVDGRLMLGRDLPELALDKRVSRRHAEISEANGILTLRDLSSRNGTFVNRVRVTSAKVVAGDVIGLGATLFYVHRTPMMFPVWSFPRAAACGPAMGAVLAEVDAASRRRTPVLFCGATGVGKGLLAEELHVLSRRGGPFVTLHVSSVADADVHGTLFGSAERLGTLGEVGAGTLFLDGIEHASATLQAALVPALDRLEADGIARIVASSSLGADRLAVVLRADLFARIGAWPIQIPPLEHRREDIPLIIRRTIDRAESADRPSIHPDVLADLLRAPWPGNVRQLLAALDRAWGRGHLERAREGSSPSLPSEATPDVVVHVAADGRWFDRGGGHRVELGTRRSLVALLRALVRASSEPERMLDVAELVEIGWPAERVLPRAGASRVYVAIATLRKLGLDDVIERTADGYHLRDGSFQIVGDVGSSKAPRPPS
jgi:transcriptional regulator of acetoin/glycerol metabolism